MTEINVLVPRKTKYDPDLAQRINAEVPKKKKETIVGKLVGRERVITLPRVPDEWQPLDNEIVYRMKNKFIIDDGREFSKELCDRPRSSWKAYPGGVVIETECRDAGKVVEQHLIPYTWNQGKKSSTLLYDGLFTDWDVCGDSVVVKTSHLNKMVEARNNTFLLHGKKILSIINDEPWQATAMGIIIENNQFFIMKELEGDETFFPKSAQYGQWCACADGLVVQEQDALIYLGKRPHKKLYQGNALEWKCSPHYLVLRSDEKTFNFIPI
ncbi:MAG: hypothetical protein V1725_02410 [archaeon]